MILKLCLVTALLLLALLIAAHVAERPLE